MGNTNKSVGNLRAYFKSQKANVYPITEHPLEKSDSYIKGIYIRMLCAILQYDIQPQEAQVLFVQRLMKGIGMTEPIKEYMKRALEIDENFAEEFIRQLKDNNLKYNFVVDALILVGSLGDFNKNHIEFISELCEMLLLTKKDVNFLVQIALSILEQSTERYSEIYDKMQDMQTISDFKCYYKNFFTGKLRDTNLMLHFYSYEKMQWNIDDYKKKAIEFSKETVIFENYNIDLSKRNFKFTDCKNIKFINCDFIGEGQPINFLNCNEINIIDCSFSNFFNRTITLTSCNNITIIQSDFKKCSKTDSSHAYGGVIFYDKLDSISIKSCKFSNCFIKTTESRYYYARGAILYVNNSIKNVNIENNDFDFCECDGRTETKVLFYGINNKKEGFKNNTITGGDICLTD